MLFQAIFVLVSKHAFHVVFLMGMYHEYKILNFPKISTFPFWVVMRNKFLSFSDNFFLFVFLINYRRQIWGEMMEIYTVLLFQTSNCFFLCLISQVK